MNQQRVWLLFVCMLLACMLLAPQSLADGTVHIFLSDTSITVDGAEISDDPAAGVHLVMQNETHEDVPKDLADLENRVVTITDGGAYRISGTAQDIQIAVKAGEEDEVRLILDNAHLTCRTAPAIAVYSARDTRTAGEYGVVIELAEGSDNVITGSHTEGETDDDIEFDGAIGAQVSLGFEGSGRLSVDADNEGIEVAYGHMTFNGGEYIINAADDPLNVSEDGFAVLTINDGFLYSAVKPIAGGEGDGIDSNGWIVFNGGTVINLAHPGSMDSGIDSDMGSTINGGLIVGAGNMYDPISEDSQQLFIMLEFSEETDDLVVVTDENDVPVFAYDFPHDYMYIAFSTPALKEGLYHVYLGGEIEGEAHNGLYTTISAYTPGVRMQHGEGNAEQRKQLTMGGMPDFGGMPPQGGEMPEWGGEMPEWGGENMPPQGGGMPEWGGEMPEWSGENMPPQGMPSGRPEDFMGRGGPGGFGGPGPDGFGGPGGFGPGGMESSADVATTDFFLTRASTGFTNVRAAE